MHARGGYAPAAIQVFAGRGQPSCEQLIDRYHIKCQPMRDVLVDYLRERQPSVDFSTLQHDAYLLGKLFWADLEAHHCGIDSLKLPRDVAAAWKQRMMTKTRTTATPDGGQHSQVSARLDGRSVMTAVRAFYLDLAEWADDEPARWAPWAVRCPISASDVSHKKDRCQRKSRMDQRTRERLPVLPTLTAWVQNERANTAAVLHAARNTTPGAVFTAGGLTLRRSVMKTPTTGRIWAEHPDSGQRHDVTFDEHRSFWTWAMVEVLRHTARRRTSQTRPNGPDRHPPRHRSPPRHTRHRVHRVRHDQLADVQRVGQVRSLTPVEAHNGRWRLPPLASSAAKRAELNSFSYKA